MEKQKDFERTSNACHECIQMLAAIDGVDWLLTALAYKYSDFLTEADQKALNEVRKDLKDCTRRTNAALEGIFSKLQSFILPAVPKPKYESFVIPREIITYENDKKILIQIPEEMEYGGYSVWFSKKFITEDPSGEMLQVRMYPDWKISLYKYEKDEKGKYQAVEMKTENAENLFRIFSGLENAFQKDDMTVAL